jgi:hypothetical protein
MYRTFTPPALSPTADASRLKVYASRDKAEAAATEATQALKRSREDAWNPLKHGPYACRVISVQLLAIGDQIYLMDPGQRILNFNV